ncbi:MAG: hypothetical protein KDH96_03260 [Candidatus Riesia sp.]|nr:hypothetical protein [Candidatus Riesia sp.]
MIEPHSLYLCMEPDQVAECLDGLPKELYLRIWNDIVPLQAEEAQKSINEDNPDGGMYPGEAGGDTCLASFWPHLTEKEQKTLSVLAEKY